MYNTKKNCLSFRLCIPFLALTLLFLSFSMHAHAQRNRVPLNIPKHDFNTLNFGFLLGVNKTDFVLHQSAHFLSYDSLFSVETVGGSGFNLGIMSELKLGEHANVRFVPDLSFTQRDLTYTFDTSRVKTDKTKFTSTKSVESTFLEFPLEFKYKSSRINNYRMYLVGGVKYSIDMASQKKVNTNDPNPYKQIVKIQKNDYGYTLGFGIDCYMQYFRFSPEIKMYQGINNLAVHDGKIFSESIESLRSKVFLLSFIFE